MPVRIITDSASDWTPPVPERLTVLPMRVAFGARTYLDGIDLSHRRFYELLVEEEEAPTTSQINPAQFEQVFQAAVDEGETVVAVLLASALSGSCQSARLAAEAFPDKVYVVDSGSVSIGEQLLVRRALELAQTGTEAPELVARLEEEKGDIRLIALLNTLEYLKRGGRISRTAAAAGELLAIKPVIAVEDGAVKLLGKARGSKNGNNLLTQFVGQEGGADLDRPCLLGYTGLSDALLQKYVADSAPLWEGRAAALPVGTIGGTVGTHVGPGAVGVAFFRRRTAP